MPSAEDPPPELRTLLGRYRVERALGRGGMGEVFLAFDELLQRRVALKRLKPSGDDPASQRHGILREARRASAITSPRVAAVHDVLDVGDEVILVMEYVDGVTLRERMGAPLPPDAFWSLATQCAQGLAAAHAHGVVHRDIKPENLMITAGGDLKVLDFGVAKQTGTGDSTTTTRSDPGSVHVAGTPHYMAPEAYLGGPVDARTDLFSLGVVFYELLTGQRPFEGNAYEVMAHVLHSTPAPVSERNPAVGAPLSDLVGAMLARDPAARVPSATALLERLESARAGIPSPPLGAPRLPERAPWRIRIPGSARARVAAMAAGALAALMAAAGIVAWGLATPPLPREIEVAVLPPATPAAAADFAAFAGGIADLAAGELARRGEIRGFQAATPTEVRDESVATAEDASRILGANLALASSFERGPRELRARLELRAPGRRRPLAARLVAVPIEEPFAFVDEVLRQTAALLRLPPPTRSAAAISGVRGAGTLRFQLQGLGRMRAAADTAAALAALADLEAAGRTEPEAATPVAARASALLLLHRLGAGDAWLDRADEAASRAVALDSTRPEPHRARAMVRAAQRRLAESLAESERAAALDPGDPELSYRLARAHARIGNHAAEKALYDEAVRRQPHAWRPHWWLATWHRRAGNLPEAIREYREMIRCAPRLYRGYANLGGLAALTGDYPAAIEALERSIALRPTRSAYGNLGIAYMHSGRLPEAVDAFNQSFQFGEADYAAWLNLGDLFWLQNRKREAADAYAEAVELGRREAAARLRRGASTDVEMAANLATVFPKLGAPDSARLWVGRALSADTTSPAVLYGAALTYWQLDEKSRALDWLERSVRSGYPVVWLRDSPLFREWRAADRFRALVGDTLPGSPLQAAGESRGG